ncbi:uncharacterized protein LOC129720812 isoform X2 [Wyeomyia smithii]|uniref:uncharacterized protein LOC129720812 isoform X2 n=1 Tax=Wyeomyia smithii TaxID=174621 RepID=UPI002467F943|nr:uncharacterized protein LOC129720812 isoform X2 [Wyeomyia smithii]
MELRIAPVIRIFTIVTVVSCVPMKYGIGYRSSIDLDAEQTEARYDQGMLSDIMNDDQVEMQKAESCVADNFKYDHGQKIQRFDPCEICLCIDGEIFCWWKQCDTPAISEILNESPVPVQMTTPPVVANRPFAQQTQLPATAVAAVSSSPVTVTTAEPLPSTLTTGKVTTSSSSSPQPPAAATVPPVSYSDKPDRNERILHHPSPANIPQNILLFPQSPPILMHRSPTGAAKNATNVARTGNRNKQKGPPKKVKPFHLNGGAALDINTDKKSYRKSKSKGHSINYGSSGRNIAGETDGIGSDERPFSNNEMNDSEGGRLIEPMKNNDGANNDCYDDDDSVNDDDDRDDNDEDDESDESTEERDVESGYRGHAGSSSSGRSAGGSFGGFGYGMIKEPEEDKQQHYIITSSGHVEMFDDTSMDATENAFGTNRLPSQQAQQEQQQQQQLPSSTTSQPMALVFRGTLIDHRPPQLTDSSVREIDEQSRPIPPLISMTTNVTQYSNYSDRQLAHAEGLSVASYVLPHATGSVIDVLNSTVDGDYLDDNQTELIYPAVSGLNGNVNGSRGARIRGSGQPVKMTDTRPSAADGDSGRSSPEPHCVVMGVTYKVGSVLKQETGNCLHCVCVAGPDIDPVPRVTCTPLNCPPLILPDILDGAGF